MIFGTGTARFPRRPGCPEVEGDLVRGLCMYASRAQAERSGVVIDFELINAALL